MRHKFVEYIPSIIEADTLYISIEYDVAKHKCACGCGEDIVTSLSPARWKLTYDGETVSLYPSIGNWSHPCKSHYFITNDKVVWAGTISEKKIAGVKKSDKEAVDHYIAKRSTSQGLMSWIKKIWNS